MKAVEQYLDDVVQAAQAVDLAQVCQAVDCLQSAYNDGRAVYVIGNGGSAAAASHLAQDLSKGSMPDIEGKRFRVLSLTDNVPFMTALSNDIGFDRVFDLQLRQFAEPNDILIVISGSGNSPNVLKAVEYAKTLPMTTISLTGFDGGALHKASDIQLHVPIMDMCKSEAVHGILAHIVADILRVKLAGKA